MNTCIQKVTVKKRFYVGMVFFHSQFGEVADKHTVVAIANGSIWTTGDFLFDKAYPEKFFPCDAGCFGWQYDDRPCRVGNTAEEAIKGGEAYFAHWKKRGYARKGAPQVDYW